MKNKIQWPDGKDFAFTVFDDTDLATFDNIQRVYSFLAGNGLLTTKSVWPIKGSQDPQLGGDTCEDSQYLNWLLELQRTGFEIALHNVTYHTSFREDTVKGINIFNELFGHFPRSHANHAGCLESLYWGNYRLSGIYELIYNILTRNQHKGLFRGHIEGDQYFWGDICKKRIQYVRNFVFPGINTLKECPIMPYHDSEKPFVNYWFASSEGSIVHSFNNCISERNQDLLEQEGGACIMYTHFASGFQEGNNINGRFKMLINRLVEKNGWFVPVSELLDYLLSVNGHHNISNKERIHLERKWLLHKLRIGAT